MADKGTGILLQRYFLRELIPHFLSSLIMICAIIVVQQLVRLSEALVAFGLSLENVLLPFLYIILPFLSLTIPMAFLVAVILTFGRLNADGEYAAMMAAGFSLRRAALPVLIVAGLLYGVAATCALNLEAWGRRELVQFFYRKTQTELDNMVRFKMQPGVFVEDFLGYVLYAEGISDDRTSFENVMLAPGAQMKDQSFTLLASSGRIIGSVESGNFRLSLDYGVAVASRPGSERNSVLKFKRADIDILRIFQQQILGEDSAKDDYRSYPPGQLISYIDSLEKNPDRDDKTYWKARYLLHQRLGNPFAIMSFALFGLVLAISDQRRGKSQAFLGAVATIIGGYVFIMGFKWLAENGHMAAPVAAWIPHIILLLLGTFLVYQKNRLPPSERTLDWANMPFINRFRK